MWHIVLFYRQDKSLPQLMLPVMTTRLLRELGYPAFAFNHLKEREDKIIGKKEVKTIYKEDNSKITYFIIEEVEEKSVVKLIEKMLVNIILTGCKSFEYDHNRCQ